MASEVDLSGVVDSICSARGYVLGEKLGTGGFKEVYKITADTGELGALKVLNKPISQLSRPRSEREVEAMLRCDHPHIARILYPFTVHEVEGDEYAYFLEEFLPGGTLASRLQDTGKLSVKDVLALGRDLIDAICYLETLNLVHRDIKPANIMFRSNGSPALVDFNIVRDLAATSITQSWLASGPATAYFAAPEQLNNEKNMIDWRTDQFLVGLVLCYAFTGRHPYEHQRDMSETVNRVAMREKRNDDVLSECDDAGLVCLERMTRPWNVQRFRKPGDLVRAWKAQETF